HFSDLDTFSSVRRPKNSDVVWKKKGPSNTSNVGLSAIVQICLWIIDSGCSKHMTSNRALLTNFVKKFLGTRVRTDNGTEFKNKTLAKFFDEVDITRQFSAARTPQQNGVVERRNRTLDEAARTMLTFANLPSFLIMKSSTTNVETSVNDDVFHEFFESFQGESSSSSLNDDVQQSPEEVILPQTNTQSIPINMIPNGDEASTSHNMFNERLEDAYFDANTLFHDPSNAHTYY
nr:putative ribonuclease H-like domain-containing protein [Tanacetum cinerariifolium]